MVQRFRRLATYVAVPCCIVISLCAATAAGIAGVFITDFLIKRLDGPVGLGGGVLIILVALNLAVPAFIAVFTATINLHHETSWRTPTVALLVCIAMLRSMGPFDIQFAPFMLSTGAIACLVSCWLLHRSKNPDPKHVIQA